MKVQELLDSPNKWTKGVFAKSAHDANGVEYYSATTLRLKEFDNKPVSFCLRGAIYYCYDEKEADEIHELVSHYIDPSDQRVPEFVVAIWNNAPERKFNDILSLIKELDI